MTLAGAKAGGDRSSAADEQRQTTERLEKEDANSRESISDTKLGNNQAPKLPVSSSASQKSLKSDNKAADNTIALDLLKLFKAKIGFRAAAKENQMPPAAEGEQQNSSPAHDPKQFVAGAAVAIPEQSAEYSAGGAEQAHTLGRNTEFHNSSSGVTPAPNGETEAEPPQPAGPAAQTASESEYEEILLEASEHDLREEANPQTYLSRRETRIYQEKTEDMGLTS